MSATAATESFSILLLGNPNTGKSTLFSALTGTRQKIANFPGVTVEAKLGTVINAERPMTVIDLPGTYSLAARSPDERVATDALLGRPKDLPSPDAIVVVVDASNFDRNLYLATQVLEFGLPTVVALTMNDIAEGRGISINADVASQRLGAPVIKVNALKKSGLDELRREVLKIADQEPDALSIPYPPAFVNSVDEIWSKMGEISSSLGWNPTRPEALRVLVDAEGPLEAEMVGACGAEYGEVLSALREAAGEGRAVTLIEAQTRYQFIASVARDAKTQKKSGKKTSTDRIDDLLTNRFWGTLIFILVMGVMFQALYEWSGPAMDAVDWMFGALGEWVGSHMAEGALRGLIVDGMIGGVGAVVIFLPQIIFLFFFIALLEDCGYMSRAAFLMDRVMAPFGLSGHSFIPLLSSFACAIPGIMGSRVIDDRSTRLTTIFIAPFMSCSARLPVYTIMIAAFVPSRTLWGFVNLQGLVLFAMYFVGVFAAIPTAYVLQKKIFRASRRPFLLELPPYRLPQAKAVTLTLWQRGGSFLRRAGTTILAVSIVVWALAYFPQSEKVAASHEGMRIETEALRSELLNQVRNGIGGTLPEDVDLATYEPLTSVTDRIVQANDEYASALSEAEDDTVIEATLAEQHSVALNEIRTDNPELYLIATAVLAIEDTHMARMEEIDHLESGAHLRQSVLGRMGRVVEPIVRPLGWDWRIGMAAIASFPAREIIIATLGTIFNVGEADEESESLKERLQGVKDQEGNRLFDLATALSIMIFFALCAQCGATLAVMYKETGGWKWPAISFVYMTGLAYVGAMITYHVTRAVGA